MTYVTIEEAEPPPSSDAYLVSFFIGVAVGWSLALIVIHL